MCAVETKSIYKLDLLQSSMCIVQKEKGNFSLRLLLSFFHLILELLTSVESLNLVEQ